MANLNSVTLSAAGASNVTPVNPDLAEDVGFGVTLSPGAVLTYNVEHTFQDQSNGAAPTRYFPHPFVQNQTVSKDGYIGRSVTGIRLNVTSWQSGSATLDVVQRDTNAVPA